jgi:amino acid transporter
MISESSVTRLASGKLSTLDCVAQSLAVGPVFSAAIIGGLLFGLSGGVGPVVIIITTIGILGLGWTVSEFAKRYSGTGTVYEFIAHTLGKRAAVFAAGVYHLAATALAGPGIVIIGGLLAHTFFESHWGLDLPWWVWGLVIAVVLYVVNVVGVEISVKAQLVLIVLSVIPILILFVKMLIDGGAAGNSFDSFNPGKVGEGGSIFAGLLFAILMFVGFELSAALGEETKDPKHSIPRAVLATIGIVGVLYVITQYTMSLDPSTQGDFVGLAENYLNHFFALWIELAILLDVIAVGIGFQVAASRGFFTLARDGLLPRVLGKVNSRSLPSMSTLLVLAISVITIVITQAKYGSDVLDPEAPDAFFNYGAFLGSFLICSTIGAFLICIVYALVCIGALKSFATKRPIDLVAAIVGLVTTVLGVGAQFYDKTKPVGDAQWGIWIGLTILVLAGAWAALAKRDAVDRVAQHTLHHAPQPSIAS